eukprot:TRINITY_DN6215_c0_g1_i1.p1 TRINITY_DN6215_c0_g1~~TRINITY_DN6215_c0_g1_i1.p1  ORF type:complete len:540 (+),score=153.13 TRINITY_DN6215_c0_g1_i1:31-1620(+)
MSLKIVSWNVNGLRGFVKKEGVSLEQLFRKHAADIFCFQETKIGEADLQNPHKDKLVYGLMHVPGYESYWSGATSRKGYSGVATYVKSSTVSVVAASTSTTSSSPSSGNRTLIPIDVSTGLGEERFDREGRVVVTHHASFVLLNVYFPNGGGGIHRATYKLDFYHAFARYCSNLRAKGFNKIIVVGDVNSVHNVELDVNPSDLLIIKQKRETVAQLIAAASSSSSSSSLDTISTSTSTTTPSTSSSAELNTTTTPKDEESEADEEEQVEQENDDIEHMILRANLKRQEKEWMDYMLRTPSLSADSELNNHSEGRVDSEGGNNFVDAFRHMKGDGCRQYTWWNPKSGARESNLGWRIDYTFVAREFVDRKELLDAGMLTKQLGSDHCPVYIVLDVSCLKVELPKTLHNEDQKRKTISTISIRKTQPSVMSFFGKPPPATTTTPSLPLANETTTAIATTDNKDVNKGVDQKMEEKNSSNDTTSTSANPTSTPTSATREPTNAFSLLMSKRSLPPNNNANKPQSKNTKRRKK